jgi:hypothetical protein
MSFLQDGKIFTTSEDEAGANMTLIEIQRLNGSNEVLENDKADLVNSLSKMECDTSKSVEDSRHEIEMVRSVHRSKVACVIAHL